MAATATDRHAVVADFLDYTEYLPAEVIRSLTLIRTLDRTYTENTRLIHDLSKNYQALPTQNASERVDAKFLRQQIAAKLNQALSARRSAHAESERLYHEIDRHYTRIQGISEKLKSLPKPPSRDPTPVPVPSSPETKRRGGRKADGPQVLRLNPPQPRSGAVLNLHHGGRVVLKGPLYQDIHDPDSPIASTEQSDGDTPVRRKSLKIGHKRHRVSRGSQPRESARGPRVSASVPEPPRPPEDAALGSEHRPWTRLTEWEMWKLRKKMKKNSGWEPSSTMVQRTLIENGRGEEKYNSAKTDSVTKGTDFVDCDREKRTPAPPVEPPVRKGPTPQGTIEVNTLQNRGMKLNEAKKMKREALAREQAKESEKAAKEAEKAAAKNTEQAAQRMMENALKLNHIFATLTPKRTTSSPIAVGSAKGSAKGSIKTNPKKRKIESVVSQSPSMEAQSVPAKKPKLAPKAPPQLVPIASAPASTTPSSSIAPVSATPSIPSLNLNLKVKMPTRSSTSTGLSSPMSPKRPPSSTHQASVPPKPAPTPPRLPSQPPSQRSTRSSVASNVPAATPVTVPAPAPASAPPNPAPREFNLRGGISTPAAPKPAPKQKTPAPEPPSKPNTRQKTPITEHVTRQTTKQKTPVTEPAPKVIPTTAASGRSKRRPPGAITQSNEDGGAKASVARNGRRAAATSKEGKKPGKATGGQHKGEKSDGGYMRVDLDGNKEWINPDEHDFYCVCQDVSYGEMISCELDEQVSLFSNHVHFSTLLDGTVVLTKETVCPRRRLVPSRMCWSRRDSSTNGQVVLP